MNNLGETVTSETELLNSQKAKERARASRSNLKTLVTSYTVLTVVIFMQFQSISSWVVGLVAVIGLGAIGITYWLQNKKIYQVMYFQELNRLNNLGQLEQEKRNNGNNILDAIKALAASVDAKDKYTYGHSERVAKNATDIARELGCSNESLDIIYTSALLHDIGKIGVSDYLLKKSGILRQTEWNKLQSHPELGMAILQNFNAIRKCLPAILHHHERFDGTGYPAGLHGASIPLGARIIAVADAYDAMITKRPYRSTKITNQQALAELALCANKQFDPEVISAFLKIRLKISPDTQRLESDQKSYIPGLQEYPTNSISGAVYTE
jgi:putative nucleotidyltransferase with HDIG domain